MSSSMPRGEETRGILQSVVPRPDERCAGCGGSFSPYTRAVSRGDGKTYCCSACEQKHGKRRA